MPTVVENSTNNVQGGPVAPGSGSGSGAATVNGTATHGNGIREANGRGGGGDGDVVMTEPATLAQAAI